MRKRAFAFIVVMLLGLAAFASLFYANIEAQAQATPTPQLTPQVYLPLVMRNYPPLSCNIPTLIEPQNMAQLTTLAPLFRWDVGDEPDAVRFELQVAQDPAFQNVIFNLITFWLTQNEERLPFNLEPSTVYYWRARNICSCEGGECPGPWTVVWSFTSAPPGGVILPAPALFEPLSVTVTSPVTFRWSAVSGAVEYGLYWRRAGTSGYAHVVSTDNQEVIYLSAGVWEWWVRARNDYAWGQPSVTGVFTSSVHGMECDKGGKCVWR